MMLAHVNPVDGGRAAADASNTQENTYRELALRDLHETEVQDKIVLNVRDQVHFFDQNSGPSEDARAYESQAPATVLADIGADVSCLGQGDGKGPNRGIDLHAAIGVNDDSDSDEDEAGGRARQKAMRVGSREARSAAQAHIWSALAKSRGDTQGQAEDEASPMGLPVDLTQRTFITNATTTEFLSSSGARSCRATRTGRRSLRTTSRRSGTRCRASRRWPRRPRR
jgi:transcription initiation factor TFIIH subunit 1